MYAYEQNDIRNDCGGDVDMIDQKEHDTIKNYCDLYERAIILQKRNKYRLAMMLDRWATRLTINYRA